MENPLSKLKLDYWYHVLMAVSCVVFLLAGVGLLHEFPTVPTVLMSLGVFCVGLGEWINHPLQTGLLRASAYYPAGVVTGHPRNPSLLGYAFLFFGVALAVVGGYKLFT